MTLYPNESKFQLIIFKNKSARENSESETIARVELFSRELINDRN